MSVEAGTGDEIEAVLGEGATVRSLNAAGGSEELG
jgi:hypothetical protein